MVCARLSVMQELAGVRRFCVQNPKFTLFLVNQETPPPSHPMKIVRDFGSEVPKYASLQCKLLGRTYVQGTDVWRLITVSPNDTVSFLRRGHSS